MRPRPPSPPLVPYTTLFRSNADLASFCRKRFTATLVPSQIAPNGSFPLELARTKPYGYSLFNLDAMTAVCQIVGCTRTVRSEEHTSELQSLTNLVCRLLLEK